MSRSTAQILALAAAVAIAWSPGLHGAEAPATTLLGRIDFPTSGAAAAQPAFLEGVLYLHNFEYEDAARSFRRAQQADPRFALAYWGEAMTYNHPIWMEQDRAAAQAVLERLAPTPGERREKAPTEREKAYLETAEILYGNTERTGDLSKEGRDLAYRDAMADLHAAYPADDEATVFYALSILGTAHQGRDFAIYMRAAAVAQEVWARNPEHPGAAHYLIHSFDDPIHAPLGLPMARAYARIAPAAAHAQHMTSHIFVALGMWDEVVAANEVATRVQNDRFAALGEPQRYCGHYPYWLEYGYLQQGRWTEAAAVLDRCRQSLGDTATGYAGWHFAVMRARYLLDTGDWSAADRWTAAYDDSAPGAREYRFTDAVAALERGDGAAAEAAHQAMRAVEAGDEPGESTVGSILDQELAALGARAAGHVAEAVALLEQAADAEADLPYEFGPPRVVQPARELLAGVLLEDGRAAEAAAAFDSQLARTPGRATSLLGLARARAAAGDRVAERAAYRRLAANWHSAEPGVPGLEAARSEAGDR